MSIALKLIAVLVGAFLIWQVFSAMKMKKMSEGQSIFWLIGAVVIIILGLFPGILSWASSMFGVWWPPAILLFCIVVILSFMAFNHAKELSVLRSQVTELSEHVTLLKDENNSLQKALERTAEPADNPGEMHN